MGHVLGLRRKILKETQEAEECLVSHPLRLAGGDEGSRAPSSPWARARPGREGLEQEAAGLRRQEAAVAAGDTCRWGR